MLVKIRTNWNSQTDCWRQYKRQAGENGKFPQLLIKLNMCLPPDPVTPLLSIYWREIKTFSHKEKDKSIHSHLYSQKPKTGNYCNVQKRVDELWCIHTTVKCHTIKKNLIYSITWVTLTNTFNKRSQVRKYSHCMISLFAGKHTKFQNRQKVKEMVTVGAWGAGGEIN